MKQIVMGVLAHVDAGKTTLSEAMLFCSGGIRSLGRVDHGDAFLDTFAVERQRGITVFSKQAVLNLPDCRATLLDTPGHVDLAPEMERTLSVLDCAVLVVSGPAGVQSHTLTLWRLLRKHRIPTFVFVNKTDLPCPPKEELLAELRRELSDGIVDLSLDDPETAAMCDEQLLEEYLSTGTLNRGSVARAVAQCKLFPCYFGAALKLEGVEEFLAQLAELAPEAEAGKEFGAKVFKISRDEQGNRMTHLKVTGGVLRVRDVLSGPGWEEKVTQIRIYSGTKYQTVEELLPGQAAAVTGLSRTAPGLGLGAETQSLSPVLEPVLAYDVLLPEGTDPMKALDCFRQLEEEEPQLHVEWIAQNRQIRVRLMGPIQLEILTKLMEERFGLPVTFGAGGILYRETIEEPVEGVGHYEPLRHYAEVHLLLEPAPRGTGVRILTGCREDDLDRNWQRLILTHLREKPHLGVLTGSPITDVTITLMSGKAHLKHTEGGDFRQATYRAVRQGLMQAKSVLLEPWYAFCLDIPQTAVGRAMTDLQRMGADLTPPEQNGDRAVLTGSAPVAALREYPQEVTAYTHGLGQFTCTPDGYRPCREQETVVEEIGYDPEADLENTPDSVFCDHGAGFVVKWHQVPQMMHLPSVLQEPEEELPMRDLAAEYCSIMATDKELLEIFERTYGPVKRELLHAMAPRKKETQPKPYKGTARPQGPEYVLVDGYNIIFAWEELKKLSQESLDLAREQLINILRNYQGFRQVPVILVFDAYKVKGNPGSIERMGDFALVYTKEAETADQYIEKVTHELSRRYRVRVATSDGLEQVIILGHGAERISADHFQEEVRRTEEAMQQFLKQ